MIESERLELIERQRRWAEKAVTPATPGEAPAAGCSAPVTGWSSLRWCADEPRRPGWWWFRASPNCKAFIVEVRDCGGGMLSAFMPWGRTFLYHTTSSEVEWAGPLPEPESALGAQTTTNSDYMNPGSHNQRSK